MMVIIALVISAIIYYMYFNKTAAAGENNLYLGADELGDDMSFQDGGEDDEDEE